jgi:hypothetical protein
VIGAIAGSDPFAEWPGTRITLSPATAPNGKPTIRITAAPTDHNGAPPVEPSADSLPTAEWDDNQSANPTPSEPLLPAATYASIFHATHWL